MRQPWHSWAGCVLITMAAAALLLALGSQLAAQAPGPTPGTAGFPQLRPDELAPRLIAGAKGETYRLWERTGDQRAGGGGVLLAISEPQNQWRTLLEITSPERGVNVEDADLAAGPADELALVYRWRRHQPRSKQIRFARSSDGGKSWTQPSTQLDSSGKAFDPRVAWGRGRSLVVVWSDERRRGRIFDVYARRSPDGGATWEPEQLLSRFPQQSQSDLYARARVVSDGQDRLWVVWVGLRSGRSALYLTRSEDGGRSWTDPIALSGTSQSVFAHSLLRAGDRLLLVWQDTRTGRDRIYAVSTSDGGKTWTPPVRVDHLPEDAPVDASGPDALLGPDGDAIVVWHDGRNGRDDVFLAHSRDGGRSWGTADLRIDTDDAGTAVSQFPRLARAADGRLAVAWDDDRAGREAIYVRVRAAGERGEWGPELRVTPGGSTTTGFRLPRPLWGSDGLLHLAWEVWDQSLGPSRIAKQVGGQVLRPDTR